jgi:hypothetical protein
MLHHTFDASNLFNLLEEIEKSCSDHCPAHYPIQVDACAQAQSELILRNRYPIKGNIRLEMKKR